MKDYTAEEPIFSGSIKIVEETDAVNADNNNAAPKQLMQNDLVLAAYLSRAVTKKDIIIPVNGWSVTDEGKEGDMYIDIPLEGVTEDMTPIISILPTDMDKAKACVLRTTCRTMTGKIRLYAARQPDTEIHAELVLLSEGSGISPGGSIGGGLENPSYTLPTATKTRLGGVRIGDGVAVGDDGTISVDAAGVLDGVAATDEDVITVLDSVFGETTP